MQTIKYCLNKTPRRFLRAIGRVNGLTLPRNNRKQQLVEMLYRSLSTPQWLNYIQGTLTEDKQVVLSALLRSGGVLPRDYISQHYGDVRPYTPWNKETFVPHPWKNPISSVEALWYQGVIYLYKDDHTRDDLLVLPDEFTPLIDQPRSIYPLPQPITTSSSGEIIHDIVALLALTYQNAFKWCHQQWFPTILLQQWASYRFQTDTASLPSRVRFLQYLAESATLIQPNTTIIKPTPMAWLWLNQPNLWENLWEAWCNPSSVRWSTFKLPGYQWLTEPIALLEPLHQYLLTLQPETPQRIAQQFIHNQPYLLTFVPPTLSDGMERLQQTIVALLTGPLCWLGVLTEKENRLHLTQHGHKLLTQHPIETTYQPFQHHCNRHSNFLKSTITIQPPTELPHPYHLFTVISLSDPQTPYQITATSFIQAIQQGWSASALLQTLNTLLMNPLTEPEETLLKRWSSKAQTITIRPAMLLETKDPQVITRLGQTKRGRALINHTYAPTTIEVDPASLPLLTKRLTRQEGVPPQLLTGYEPSNQKEQVEAQSSPALDNTVAAYLLTTVRVYQQLGNHINLPLRIPQTIIDQLQTTLSDQEIASSHLAVSAVMDELVRSMVGQAVFPSWSDDGLPIDVSLPVIESALQSGQCLTLHYYAASHNQTSVRVVEPYRIEGGGAERGMKTRSETSSKENNPERSLPKGEQSAIQNPLYLIAFCHQAQAERIFRLDRIQQIALMDDKS